MATGRGPGRRRVLDEALVDEIIALRASTGWGASRIADYLNERQVPTAMQSERGWLPGSVRWVLCGRVGSNALSVEEAARLRRTEPRICSACGRQHKPTRRGLCGRCYEKARLRGELEGAHGKVIAE